MTQQYDRAVPAENAYQDKMDECQVIEGNIVRLFSRLPKDRQKAILTELWSEIKPAKPKGQRNYGNIPY